jgi:hypothetical protein
VHDADRARTRDPGSDTIVRAAPPNQSFQNLQVMERGGGPSYTPDQLPCPLAMSEGAGCTRGMATGPFSYCTISAHVMERVAGLNPGRSRNASISRLSGRGGGMSGVTWVRMVQ